MRIHLLTHASIIVTATCGLALPSAALGQDTEAAAEIAALRAQVTDLQEREAAARQTVDALEARLSRLERIDAEPISLEDAASMRGRFAAEQTNARPSDPAFRMFGNTAGFAGLQDQRQAPAGTAAPIDPPGDSASDSAIDLKAPAPTAAQEDVTEQQQGTFGRRLGVEFAATYTHFDNARINLDGFLALDAIFLGTISIDRINADIFTWAPSIDVGLSDRLSVDASLPLLSRFSNFQSGGAGGSAAGLVERTVSGNGIGDASIGINYRVLPESVSMPDVVLNTRIKLPTGRHPFGIEFVEVEGSEGNLSIPARLSYGTGVYGASLGVSVLKTLDPMIVFGSLTYFHNFDRSFDDINEIPGDQPGKVSLGNAYQLGAGLAFALNDKSSISMSYTQRLVDRTRLQLDGQEARDVVGSQANVALVNLGATFSLGPKVSLVTNIGMGLTNDSPDMAVSIRIPYRF